MPGEEIAALAEAAAEALAETLTKNQPSFSEGQWQAVSSSNVAQWKWERSAATEIVNFMTGTSDVSGVLTVEFTSGREYVYENIPLSTAESFAHASSPGQWVWKHVRHLPAQRTA